MNKKIKLIQDTMISTLNFSQHEIDNVKNYSNELINEIIDEITNVNQFTIVNSESQWYTLKQ